MTVAEAARRHGVSAESINRWRNRFVDPAAAWTRSRVSTRPSTRPNAFSAWTTLRDDRGELDLVDENTGEVIDVVPAPIAVVSDNGSCFRGETCQSAFAGDEPLLRHVRTRVRSPQTNGVIGRFFGTLKYEHLYRAPIDDGGALAMETARFRDICNRIRPHQALDDRTPRQAYLDT